MIFSVYQLLWFFLVYSFAGWLVGTAVAAVREKKFIDVGALYGPFCPAYGACALLFAVFLQELGNRIVFLFIGGVVISTLLTMLTGLVLEKIFHRKWWDYSRKRFQFGDYVSLPYAVVWGVVAVVCVCFINPFICDVIAYIPHNAGRIILIVIYAVIGADLIGTITGIVAVHSKIRKISVISNMSDNLQKAADLMGEGVTGWVLKHFEKSYPNLNAKKLLEARQEKERLEEKAKERAGVFAVGCSFYKLICLFFIGAFLGDITETIFCYATTGQLMSRSSVVYGPFSIVWGLGCVLLTVVLYKYRNRSDRYIFLFGTLVGGVYEYMCSVFTEIVFGTVFWDYSHIPFNLGGRINLLYCFFWGIAAVVWLKILYPRLSGLIEKIPKKAGTIVTWVLIVFMIFDMIISALALARYNERHTGESVAKPNTSVSTFIDEHFPDERMERIYPNAVMVSK